MYEIINSDLSACSEISPSIYEDFFQGRQEDDFSDEKGDEPNQFEMQINELLESEDARYFHPIFLADLIADDNVNLTREKLKRMGEMFELRLLRLGIMSGMEDPSWRDPIDENDDEQKKRQLEVIKKNELKMAIINAMDLDKDDMTL
mgnify:CR=1 FL=1